MQVMCSYWGLYKENNWREQAAFINLKKPHQNALYSVELSNTLTFKPVSTSAYIL